MGNIVYRDVDGSVVTYTHEDTPKVHYINTPCGVKSTKTTYVVDGVTCKRCLATWEVTVNLPQKVNRLLGNLVDMYDDGLLTVNDCKRQHVDTLIDAGYHFRAIERSELTDDEYARELAIA